MTHVTTGSGALRWGGGGTLLEVTMDALTPKIAEITAEGLSLSADLTGQELGLTDADVSICGTVAVGVDLRVVERTICVDGVVEGIAVRQCVRCLKAFDDPMAFSIHVAYEREGKAQSGVVKRNDSTKGRTTTPVEVEPEERNDDLYYFTGDHLDLVPMVREQVILASPMHPLCNEACRGLCARCGKDLNEGLCRCPVETTESPFEVLRTLKETLRQSKDH